MSSEQYFSRAPSSRTRRSTVRLALSDLAPFDLVTDRGVFSAREVDAGTRILLRRVRRPPREGHLLDLGCGYGPIAIAVAARSPGAVVWAVDVNERALSLTAENASAAGLDNVRAVPPRDVPSAIRFAAIYSNPPIRIGKQPLHELLSTWLARLEPPGAAWFVVQRNLGSDSLARWLADERYRVTRVCSERGYRVLEVKP